MLASAQLSMPQEIAMLLFWVFFKLCIHFSRLKFPSHCEEGNLQIDIFPAFLFVPTDSFMHFRGPVGNRRIVVKRNIGERIGGPPQKRFNPGNAYNR